MGGEKGSSYREFGFISSVLGHLLVGGALLFELHFGGPLTDEVPVYSVTLEGGVKLGGISNVAEKENKVVPPKTAQQPPKKEEPKEEEKKPEVKPEEKKPEEIKPVKEEVKEKEETIPVKETPKPTPPPKVAPTTAPKKTSAPAVKPTPEPKKETPEDLEKEYQKGLQKLLGSSTQAKGQGVGAGKLGGQGTGGGILKPREFFIYRDTIQKLIKQGWRWYDTSRLLIAEAEFLISKEGQISGARIVKSSGNSSFDESVIRAILQANPLPEPPPTVYEDFRTVRMIFDPMQSR